MLIKWHGHACFEIITLGGLKIVIDPHDGYSLGLKPPDVKADYVLVTHEHFDHNAVNVVSKAETKSFVMKFGEFRFDDIVVQGIKAYHDKAKGRRRGDTAIYRIFVDGIYVTHVGDLGHIPDEETIRSLKPTNILLLPVGGTFTIEPNEAWELSQLLKPNIVIPMHYWVPGCNLPLKPVEEFLKLVSWEVIRYETNEVEVLKDKLPSENKVYVLKY